MAPRSRTGCLTCRQRKLKCSEERPICAQCAKASRECVPASGITFRHQQNPSMNGDPRSRDSLKSFYGYKETFRQETTWVPVPQELTFVYTNNPYADEEGTTGENVDSSLGHDGASFGQYKQENDFVSQLEQAAYPAYATHGLEALSAVASQDTYNYAPPPAPMATQETTAGSSMTASSPPLSNTTPAQNLDFILNQRSTPQVEQNRTVSPHTAASNIDPRLHAGDPAQQAQPGAQSPTNVRTNSYTPVRPTSMRPPSLLSQGNRTRENAAITAATAFLIRDFSERAGAWMDLFDLGSFFATTVPVLAVSCPLLLYSCTALGAKSLARVDGRKPVIGGQISPRRRSRMESWKGVQPDAEGWVLKARENYDLAVSLLRQALAGASRPPTSALPSHASSETISIAQGAPLPDTDSDELVAATAILCVYEFLDASGPEWSRHLDGAKTLFEVAQDRMVPLTRPPSPLNLVQQLDMRLAGQAQKNSIARRKGPSKGRTAVFWNFARQDMLSAFINNTHTRLDVEDIPMWKSAGLKLTPDGFICASNPRHPDYIAENAMPDDTISNALIWLQMKLTNFIAVGDEMPAATPLGLGVRQHNLLDYWNSLDRQLAHWHDGLPDSFRSTAVVSADTDTPIKEQWFPQSMCASTMQHWHFSRITLLHNKPHLSTASPMTRRADSIDPTTRLGLQGSSLAARHASYAAILQQSRFHAKEIIAIDLGRADEATRIHAVQPLWTAGLVLGSESGGVFDDGQVSAETEMWRRTIVRQLRGIERDMGWASEYRVQSLLELWELPGDWGIND